jgi:hypothetical protein
MWWNDCAIRALWIIKQPASLLSELWPIPQLFRSSCRAFKTTNEPSWRLLSVSCRMTTTAGDGKKHSHGG